MAFPKTLGLCIDQAYKLRADRLAMQKEVDALEEQEKALQAHVIELLEKSKVDGAKGKVAVAAISITEYPQITDYDAFKTHILKTGELELLQQRPATGACKERWEVGKGIPGIDRAQAKKLSLTKVGGK